MAEEKTPPSLDELEARIRKAREGQAGSNGQASPNGRIPQGSLGWALRIGIDLVAAMVVSVGGGLLFDRWLGTAPWGLIVMFLLGAAAGILNVYRSVSGVGYSPGYRRIDRNDRPRDGGSET